MASYQLKVHTTAEKFNTLPGTAKPNEKMLLSNVHWFISVRWIVIAIFFIGGVTAKLFSEKLAVLGFILPYKPVLIMAVVIFVINSNFFLFCRKLKVSDYKSVTINLWTQIIVDLIFVTILVYYFGLTSTFIPFLYLIHITLSCLFFPRGRSVVVACIASVLYLLSVLLQISGFLGIQTILIASENKEALNSVFSLFQAVSAVFIWFIIWYFISTLSDTVRERDIALNIANIELKTAQEEKTKQVLITTHDLKAPFVGIESNISVLKYIYWKELPDSCRNIIDKIDLRSKTLRERIKQILDLGNIRTQFQQEIQTSPVSLKNIFDAIFEEMEDQILERKIILQKNILDISIDSNENSLLILFSNLISNAIFYTPENGVVEIRMELLENSVQVSISDTGIGIAEEYLDKIFDEYFRTPEAARFNKMSTGLGLQIVKTIAEKLDLSLIVISEINNGTTFTVGIKL